MKLVFKLSARELLDHKLLALGYSQRGFAKKIGMSYPHFNNIINNKIHPSATAAKKIYKGSGLGLDDLFFIVNGHNSNQ